MLSLGGVDANEAKPEPGVNACAEDSRGEMWGDLAEIADSQLEPQTKHRLLALLAAATSPHIWV